MPPEVQHFESSDTEPHRLQPWERQSVSSLEACNSDFAAVALSVHFWVVKKK